MGQFSPHAIDRINDVCARLSENNHDHRWPTFGQGQVPDVLHGVQHIGDIGEMYRSAIAVRNDERNVILSPRRLIVGIDLEVPFIVLNRAFRTIGIGRRKRRADVFEPDAIFGQGVWVEFELAPQAVPRRRQ